MSTARLLSLVVLAGAASLSARAQSWESEAVRTGPDGRLQYASDVEGNRVPDFSRAGYGGGGVALPEVPTARAVAPVDGDDTASVQAAIDAVEALPPNADGLRGAVELAAGTYEISGTLVIDRGGVVLRGAGDGDDPASSTVLVRSGANQDPVVYVGRSASAGGDALIGRVSARAPTLVADDVVPIGARTFEVANPERVRAGDPVVLFHPATAAWVAAVDGGGTASDPDWEVDEYPIAYARTVLAVDGATVTLDAPVFYRLDRSVSESFLYRRDVSGVTKEVGVEDLRIEIETRGPSDETQARNALVFALVENGWVTGVTARHFWHAGVSVQNSRYVTVRGCQALEPHSLVSGGRRYNFEVEKSQLVLFEGNRATKARHAYVGNGTSLDSGIVFLDNTSEDASTSSEAHRQWGMGFLYDNHVEIGSRGTGTSDRRIHLGNRGDYGSSHGWACANCVVWNADMNGALVVVEKPPTAQNYAIGVSGTVSADGPFLRDTDPYIEGTNRDGLMPRSLYLRQLDDAGRPVASEPSGGVGTRFLPPAPNPSRGSVRLAFELAAPAPVRLSVFDVLGREVVVAASGPYGVGRHDVVVPAGRLAPGTYLARLAAGADAVAARSFTVVR
ncbi:hypothetical protein RQM47_07890 [Rubrivirga sp. S365]|uniref:hypothetical protein n=1 Tax=Rubrivirga sp. S365 TaxID=3076080 RepID=UPI0028C9779E|nr:hypothetical protein [Rubrivirga sp. S365]MDT7856557.1 hypothetical protein [Rubrivirga sp. S365]